jgi:hypothetical protein
MVWGRSLLPTRFLLPAAMALACAVVPAAAQSQGGTLAIAADVSSPLTISAADLKTMPRTSVTVMAEGRETSDKRLARSVRMLQKLEIVRLRK